MPLPDGARCHHTMRSNLPLLTTVLLAASSARAVPAPPFPIHLRNADGSTVLGRLFGDEHLSWAEDLDGYGLTLDESDGAWHYARPGPDGRLVATPWRAGGVDPRALDLGLHARPTPPAARAAVERQARFRMGASTAPLQGEVPNLVLLVKFQDQTPTFQPEDFEAVLNGPRDSVADFYSEATDGRMKLVSTITGWIELPYPAKYYAYNDYVWHGRPEMMLVHAVEILDKAGFDFPKFDANGDGIIDAIDLIHSGPGYENTGDKTLIHSHFAQLSQMGADFASTSGIRFVAYHTEPELRADGSSITQIGVICHETGHFFGLPDLYDTTSHSAGLGLWSIMSSGSWGGPHHDGTRPTHFDAWSKMKLGLLAPEVIDVSTSQVRLAAAEFAPSAVVLRAGMPPGQFFLLENRQRLGYDEWLPAGGLLVFHVDESVDNNDDPQHFLVDLEQPDGRRELNRRSMEYGDAGDVYPFSGNDAFAPDTLPASLPYGTGPSYIHVRNIARSGGAMVFDVEIKDPLPLGAPCKADRTCASLFCVDGVCCDHACSGGICGACATSRGADVDGTCKLLDAVPCEDGDLCTLGEVCSAGRCVGGEPVICEAVDTCHEAGACDPMTGACSSPVLWNDAECDDGNACTTVDTCLYGICRGGEPVRCPPPDDCHVEGVCDPASGACTPVAAPDGTDCADGSCLEGVCRSPVSLARCGCGTGGGPSSAGAGLGGLWALHRLRRKGREPGEKPPAVNPRLR